MVLFDIKNQKTPYKSIRLVSESKNATKIGKTFYPCGYMRSVDILQL